MTTNTPQTPLDIIAEHVGRDAPDYRAAAAIMNALAHYRWHFVQWPPESLPLTRCDDAAGLA